MDRCKGHGANEACTSQCTRDTWPVSQDTQKTDHPVFSDMSDSEGSYPQFEGFDAEGVPIMSMPLPSDATPNNEKGTTGSAKSSGKNKIKSRQKLLKGKAEFRFESKTKMAEPELLCLRDKLVPLLGLDSLNEKLDNLLHGGGLPARHGDQAPPTPAGIVSRPQAETQANAQPLAALDLCTESGFGEHAEGDGNDFSLDFDLGFPRSGTEVVPYQFDDELRDFSPPDIFVTSKASGPPLSDKLSKFINEASSRKTEVTSVLEKFPVPSNCEQLLPPQVNPEFWNSLGSMVKTRDLYFQKTQGQLSHTITAVAKLAQELCHPRHSVDVTKCREVTSDALSLLCHVYFHISVSRRQAIKPYLSKKYGSLCTAEFPTTSSLFGDNIRDRVSEIDNIARISKRTELRRGQNPQAYGPRRGQQSGRVRRGYRPYPARYSGGRQYTKGTRTAMYSEQNQAGRK